MASTFISLPDITVVVGDISIIQPISVTQGGPWDITDITGVISLPTGASTALLQTDGNASLASIDSKTPALVSGRVPVDGSGVTQPISAVSLPLPTGAATEATLSAMSAKLPAALGQTTSAGSLSVVLASDQPAITVSGTIAATQSGSWSVTANAGTNLNTSLLALDSTLTNKTQFTQITDGTNTALITAAGAIKVDGSAVTQPVSGTIAFSNTTIAVTNVGTFATQSAQSGAWAVTANAGTNLNTSALNLESTQSAMSAKLPATLGQKTMANSLAIVLASDQSSVPTTFSNTTIAVTNAGTFATQATQAGTWNINNISGTVSLPTGASTAAKQPALGIAGTASADVITIQGIASMTAVKVDGTGGTFPISGTVAATQSGAWTVTANAGTNLNTSLLALDSTLTNKTQFTKLTDGTNTASVSAAGAVKVDGSAVTQPVSGTVAFSNTTIAVTNAGTFAVQSAQSGSWSVTANAGTNLNTSLLALESGGNLASIKTNTDNLNLAQASTTSGQKGNLILAATTTAAPSYTTAQSNPLSLTTAGALRTDSSATTQPVSGTIAFSNTTIAVTNVGTFATQSAQSGSWTVTANAGTNLNTSALALDATLTNKTQFTKLTDGTNTATISAAGALKTDSSATTQPVSGTVAFSNTTIAVTNAGTFAVQAAQSGTWNITNVSGTISLPTGASTSALQTTGNTSLASIDTKIPSGLTVTSTRLLVDGSGVTQPVSGTVTTTAGTLSTATLTNVSGSASSVQLLASTAGRKQAVFYNDSTVTMYLKFGTTASTTSFTILMRPNDYYELPVPCYTGRIDAIWDSATGAVRITELT